MSLAAGAFDQIVDVLVPEGGALVALAEVYVDESGSHAGSPILAIGGYVFLKSRARAFRQAWAEELRRKKAPCFHMTDCANGQKHYKPWPMRERIAHETKLIELTRKYSSFGFSVGLNEKQFEEIFQGFWLDKTGTGYSLLLRNTLFAVKGWADRVGFKGEFAYFFEAGHRDAAQSNAIMNRIFSWPDQRKRYRYVAHSYVDKMSALPLQSADLLAWLARDSIIKGMRGRPPRKDFLALMREGDDYKHFDYGFLLTTKAQLDMDALALIADHRNADPISLMQRSIRP